MEKESQKSKFQTPTLSDDIIFGQILPRLPIKPLFRFKSVSKSWLSTLSTPQFAKSHQKFSTPLSLQFLLFSGNDDSPPLFTSVSFDQHGRVEETHEFNHPFNGIDGPIQILGCCNGLVCFCNENYNFYIYNPATNQCREIINCPINSSDNIISAGFGYVSSIDDYKVLCLTKKSKSNHILRFNELVNANVYIFSLRNNKWVQTLSIFNVDDVVIDREYVPSLVNDVLYWYSTASNKYIVGVNLINEEIVSAIPVTIEDMINWPYQMLELIGIKGKLCLCYSREIWSIRYLQEHKVWRLNEDKLSWMKMYDLNSNRMSLLGVSEITGKWLVLKGKLLALLDPSKRFYLQYLGGTYFGGGNVSKAWDYKMSLVSPFLI